jgi:hypothetical protein
LMMASAGNDNNTSVLAPARYDSVITIGATVPWSYGGEPVDEGRIHTGWNGWWWGSTYGPLLNVMGFGERTYSTYGSGDGQYWDGVNHWFFNGTSCACPTSAGVMALIMSSHPGQTNQWYWDRIEQTADDLDVPGFDDQTGWGRVNAFRAVRGSDCFTSIDVLGFTPLKSPKITGEAFTRFESIHDVAASNPFCDTTDLYRIYIGETGPYKIDLDIFTWGEDLDMELYNDPLMSSMIASSTGPNHADSSFEQILFDGIAGKYCFLKVYSPALGNSTTYGLTIEKM